MQASNRCFSCLKTGHITTHCQANRNCRKCGGKFHHQAICLKDTQHAETEQSSQNEPTVTATVNGKNEVLLQTAQGYVYGEDKSKKIPVNILFDGGSQRSYVTDEVRRKLNLNAETAETINLNTFGSQKSERKKCDLVCINLDVGRDEQPVNIAALCYPTICSPISSRIDVSDYPHLLGLRFADRNLGERNKRIDLLIGADYLYNIIIGEVVRGISGPVAVSSKLGWLITGQTFPDTFACSNVTSNLTVDNNTEVIDIPDSEILENETNENDSQEITDSLKEFWKHESLGVSETRENDKEAEKTKDFDIKFNGHRYEVSLPWRNDFSEEPLSDNYDICVKRLKSLQGRLKNDPELLSEYNSIFQQQLQQGIIERVPEGKITEGKAHFICHHGVVRKDHDTTKLRIVFDGSAKSGPEELSLNDRLEVGENYMPSLFDTLLRFRSHSIAITADIEKAFLQIEINEPDRDVLRFLWFDDVSKDNPSIVQLRWKRLAFGLRPAPSILGATIRKHISLFQDDNPEVVNVLSRLYADDLSCGTETVEKGLEIYNGSKEIMSKGGFNLRKWKTNDPDLLEQINALEGKSATEESKNEATHVSEDDQSFTKYSIGLPNSDSNAKVLGVNWNTDTDKLFFNLTQIEELVKTLPPTKRSLLKIAAKVFDPLGCLSLFTVNLKAFFQQLCVEKVGWDEELEGKNREQYEALLSNFKEINGIQIERCLFDKGKEISKVEIHAFSDASENAFATVAYLRVVYETGEVSVRFLASKARVAPLKRQTIPRLELMGAQLMAKLVDSVRSTMKEAFRHRPIDTFYWVDSIATLCWIKNARPWKQFVRNRVSDILTSSSRGEWFYCPGPQNPADLPSRGKFGPSLPNNLFWWEGPGFLKSQQCDWPGQKTEDELGSKDAMEEKVKYEPTVTHAMISAATKAQLSNVFEMSRFSSKGKLLRTLAWVLRFIKNLKSVVIKKPLNLERQVSATETEDAEKMLIRSIQGDTFRQEIEYLQSNKGQKPPLYITQFNLFLDEDKLLRCRTRINKASVVESGKQPILLPTNNYFSELVVQDCHQRIFHNGTRETLNLLRQSYWLPKGREIVKKLVRRCFLCRKLEGLPFKTIFCPDLPPCRVDEGPPFVNTGVDFAGPLLLSNKSNESSKYYVCLFTCMSTRAIHLELVESLSVEAFLRAFRRFVGRRGLPAKMLSDNAKTYKSAAKEVRKLLRTPRLFEALALQGVKWQFITERSPWEGGAWERMIRSVKRCIVKVVGRAMLDFNEMNTILVEIEGVINSRPITYVHDDSEGISYPLTPSHLVNGRNLSHLPHNRYYEVVSTYETLSKRAKYNRLLLGHFTKRWKNEYLLGLMEVYKPKIHAKEPMISTGDVVLLKDEQTKRSFWKLGKVLELFPGIDGSVRSAKVLIANMDGKFGTKVLCRPLKLLVPLEVCKQIPLQQAPAQPAS